MNLKLFVVTLFITHFSFCMDTPTIKKIIFVVGPAGSGKTTLSTAFATENYKYCAHYSIGNLLREKAKEKSDLGVLIKGYLDLSDIVPLEVGMRVVEDALLSESKPLILIDGFPPTIEYMKAFEALMIAHERIKLLGAIAFEIDQNVAEERVLGRCRSDDKKDNFLKRYTRYTINKISLSDRFAAYGLRKIDGGQSLEKVKIQFGKSISELTESH